MQGFTLQPNYQQVQQVQQQPQQVNAPPAIPDKIKGHRGVFEPPRVHEIFRACGNSAQLLGKSLAHPSKPADVPATAPDLARWLLVETQLIEAASAYEALYKKGQEIASKKAKASRAPRSTEGNLVFLAKSLSNLIDQSGICRAPETRDERGNVVIPARIFKFPEQSGVTFASRPIMTSVINALVDRYNTKHPVESSYFHVDIPELAAVFTPQLIDALAKSKPKSQSDEAKRKKAEKEKKNPTAKKTKPRESGARVKMMIKVDANGVPFEPQREIPYINTTAITTLQGMLFLSVNPRGISPTDAKMLADATAHFKHLTEERRERQDKVKKDKKATGKTNKVAQTIAQAPPIAFQTLHVNPQYHPIAQVTTNGQVTFQPAPAQVPQTHSTTAATMNFPAGFTPAPGVSFQQNRN